MPVTYDDVETLELGKKAKIDQLANLKLENDMAQADRQLDAEKQMLNEKQDSALTEDALAFIDEMDKAHDNGEDPMKIFQSLTPELQQRISEIFENKRGQQQNDGDMDDFQPMPMNPNNPNPGQPLMDGSGQGRGMGRQIMAQQGQGQPIPQQAPSTTDIAKSIATNI